MSPKAWALTALGAGNVLVFLVGFWPGWAYDSGTTAVGDHEFKVDPDKAKALEERRRLLRHIRSVVDGRMQTRYFEALATPLFGDVFKLNLKQVLDDYGPFFKGLNMSHSELDALTKLLAYSRMDMVMAVKLSSELVEAGVSSHYHYGKDYWNLKIAEQIGPERLAELEKYTGELPVRRGLDQLERKLDGYSLSLDERQRSNLLQTMLSMPVPPAVSTAADAEARTAYAGAVRDRFEALIERSSSYLSVAQAELIKLHFNEQLELIDSRFSLYDKTETIKREQRAAAREKK